jgi:hypothetical protein
MKRAGVITAAAIALAAGSVAAAPPQQKLIELEAAWTQAVLHKDVAALSQMMADDWTGGGEDGKWSGRAQFLDEIKNGDLTFSAMTNHDVHVRMVGRAAVVSGLEDEKSAFKGKDTSGAYSWMDIWEQRDGRWVVVASQNTRVRK